MVSSPGTNSTQDVWVFLRKYHRTTHDVTDQLPQALYVLLCIVFGLGKDASENINVGLQFLVLLEQLHMVTPHSLSVLLAGSLMFTVRGNICIKIRRSSSWPLPGLPFIIYIADPLGWIFQERYILVTGPNRHRFRDVMKVERVGHLYITLSGITRDISKIRTLLNFLL